VDQAEIDQDLGLGMQGRIERGEDAAHQGVPVRDAARCVIALVAIRRRGEAERGFLALHQHLDAVSVCGRAAEQAVFSHRPKITGAGHRHPGCLRNLVGGIGTGLIVFIVRLTGAIFQMLG